MNKTEYEASQKGRTSQLEPILAKTITDTIEKVKSNVIIFFIVLIQKVEI